MGQKMPPEQVKEALAYTTMLIESIASWYSSGAVDCPETRRNINKDLDTVLPRVEKKFGLKKIPKVLRARWGENGYFKVRIEDPFLT